MAAKVRQHLTIVMGRAFRPREELYLPTMMLQMMTVTGQELTLVRRCEHEQKRPLVIGLRDTMPPTRAMDYCLTHSLTVS